MFVLSYFVDWPSHTSTFLDVHGNGTSPLLKSGIQLLDALTEALNCRCPISNWINAFQRLQKSKSSGRPPWRPGGSNPTKALNQGFTLSEINSNPVFVVRVCGHRAPIQWSRCSTASTALCSAVVIHPLESSRGPTTGPTAQYF